MKTPAKDYLQQKINGGEQKIILNSAETGETDELDPKFDQKQKNDPTTADQKIEPGDDPSTELI